MKAKEYYAKYKAGLMSADEEIFLSTIREFLSELFNEINTIKEARHVRFDSGFFPILREQNEKYKAVVRLFEKEYGSSPIREDGLELFLEHMMPEVVKKMKGRAAGANGHAHAHKGF